HRSSSRLGSAVSSSTPKDFHPSPTMGQHGSCPLMKRHALRGPAMGRPYTAVGMQRASHSAIGLPSSSSSAWWMLAFLMPAEVRSNFMLPLLLTLIDTPQEGRLRRRGVQQTLWAPACLAGV